MINTLTISHHHNAGFFSCCSIRLFKIIEYINNNKKTPVIIDCANQFHQYKTKEQQKIDISLYFFKLNKSINIENHNITLSSDNKELQFSNYKLINFHQIKPIIDKYFNPTDEINKKISIIEEKYNINYKKLLTVYYRSTDKSIETNIPSIETIINKISEVKKINPELQILYMTDELTSIKKIRNQFKDVIIIEEIEKYHHRSYEHAQWFMSSIVIMSKAHSIITTSGNVSNWMIYYRNHSNNIYQYLSPKNYIYGIKNTSYDPNQTNFWL
jgi:hypothetical protein